MDAPQLPFIPTGDIMDDDWYPTFPDPPEGIIDGISYIPEVVLYVVRLLIFLIRAIVLGIGNTIAGIVNIAQQIMDAMSFLPSSITMPIGISIILIVVIKFLKRGS